MENHMQSVTVKVFLKKEDMVNANVMYIKSKMKLAKKQWFFLFITMFMIVILLMFILIQFTNGALELEGPRSISKSDLNFFLWSGILLILLILLRSTAPLIVRKSAIKQYESSTDFQKEIDFIFSEKGISIHSDTGVIELFWDKNFTIVESQEYFVIIRSNMVEYTIPKRCLAGDEDLQVVTEMIRDNMSVNRYKIVDDM